MAPLPLGVVLSAALPELPLSPGAYHPPRYLRKLRPRGVEVLAFRLQLADSGAEFALLSDPTQACDSSPLRQGDWDRDPAA